MGVERRVEERMALSHLPRIHSWLSTLLMPWRNCGIRQNSVDLEADRDSPAHHLIKEVVYMPKQGRQLYYMYLYCVSICIPIHHHTYKCIHVMPCILHESRTSLLCLFQVTFILQRVCTAFFLSREKTVFMIM